MTKKKIKSQAKTVFATIFQSVHILSISYKHIYFFLISLKVMFSLSFPSATKNTFKANKKYLY